MGRLLSIMSESDTDLRFERVSVFLVLAEIETDRFGFLIDAQGHNCSSYF
jgi:hypothetical protein